MDFYVIRFIISFVQTATNFWLIISMCEGIVFFLGLKRSINWIFLLRRKLIQELVVNSFNTKKSRKSVEFVNYHIDSNTFVTSQYCKIIVCIGQCIGWLSYFPQFGERSCYYIKTNLIAGWENWTSFDKSTRKYYQKCFVCTRIKVQFTINQMFSSKRIHNWVHW